MNVDAELWNFGGGPGAGRTRALSTHWVTQTLQIGTLRRLPPLLSPRRRTSDHSSLSCLSWVDCNKTTIHNVTVDYPPSHLFIIITFTNTDHWKHTAREIPNRFREIGKFYKLEATGRTRSGIWFELSGSVSSIGRKKLVAFVPISLAETARSNSKARMSVNSRALILKIFKQPMFDDKSEGKKKKRPTHSTSENRKPIQARGPPMNVIMFAQTPGIDAAAFGIFVQRSGLRKKKKNGFTKVLITKAENEKILTWILRNLPPILIYLGW